MALKGYKITSLTVFFYNAHIITKSYDSVKPVIPAECIFPLSGRAQPPAIPAFFSYVSYSFLKFQQPMLK